MDSVSTNRYLSKLDIMVNNFKKPAHEGLIGGFEKGLGHLLGALTFQGIQKLDESERPQVKLGLRSFFIALTLTLLIAAAVVGTGGAAFAPLLTVGLLLPSIVKGVECKIDNATPAAVDADDGGAVGGLNGHDTHQHEVL